MMVDRPTISRARYCKALEAAAKKKQLITRGAAAGVDPNVRNALYLADTADVSEEDIFGNPELMPKLSAALKTITKRKRVKGKPLVDLIATVQRDGSLPACVQSSNGAAASSTTPSSAAAGAGAAAATKAGAAGSASKSTPRRQIRPPALLDAIETSNEEYAANMEHAYGSVHNPESSTSATTSVSPALSSLGNSGHSSADEFASHGWGHNSISAQQQGYGSRSLGSTPAAAAAAARVVNADGSLRGGRLNGDGYLQDSLLDSPTSSCATIVAGNSPSGGEHRLSPGGSFSAGGISPAVGGGAIGSSATNGVLLQQPPSFNGAGSNNWMGQQLQPSPAGGQQQRQLQQQQQQQQQQQKRVSAASSLATTDMEGLDTSHLLEFDDDEDDEAVPYSGPGYTAPGGGDLGYVAPATSAGGGGSGSGGGGGGGGGSNTGSRVSPEDLQELEDALLMDSFTGVIDEILEGEDIPTAFPKLEESEGLSFPGLPYNGPAKPAVRAGTAGVPRGTPRSAGANRSPRVQMFGGRGVSPSHAGCASPVGATASTPSGTAGGPPRPGPRGAGRPRSSQVPPRPYTPGNSSRGGLFLAHGLRGESSPRVGSSPRPPTPGTPGTHATTPGGTRRAPSPNGRRRGDEAFPPEHFSLPSPNDPLGANGLMGGPSPKSRRVGARAFPERFPGSPQAGLSPRVGFPPQSPLSGGKVPGFSVGCTSLASDRNYFPAPAANAAAAAALADASGRGHRRSSSSGLSSGWGSAPRHGGAGEGGFDAGGGAGVSAAPGAVAAAAVASTSSSAMSTAFPASTSTSTSAAQNWGAKSSWGLTLGDLQQQQQQQQNGRPGSPLPNLSANGQQQQMSSMAKRHGVVRRRHSAPIPPLTPSTAPSAAELAGEVIMSLEAASSSGSSSSGGVKAEFQTTTSRQSLESNGGGGDHDNFSATLLGTGPSAGGAAKWAGIGASAPAPAPTQMATEGDGSWWSEQQQQAGVGGMALEQSLSAATGADVSCKFEMAVDDPVKGKGGEMIDAHVLTPTMPVDL